MNRRGGKARRILGLAFLAALLMAGTFAGVTLESAGIWPFRPEAGPAYSGELPEADERLDGLHFTLYDPEGRVILQTGIMVTVGDEYVNEDNLHYRVVSIVNDRCQTVLLGTFSLEPEPDAAHAGAAPYVPAQAPRSAVVGVYHTHGNESYVPGDGAASKRGLGGIGDVAQQLAAAARQTGLNVLYNSTHHGPHDTGAYRRSRRTVTALLRQGAGTLLDVHRDAAPPEAYATTVDGKPASRAMLVVGRANPQMRTTLNFARDFKRTIDEKYPGLMRGIYFGRGSYNQDTSSRAVLVEIGSHRTPKEHAIRTAGLIGSAIADILGVAAAPGGEGGVEGEGRSAWANLGWIVLVVAIGSGVYLVYASGGWRQAADKLRGFVRREFAGALAPRRSGGTDEGRGGGSGGGGDGAGTGTSDGTTSAGGQVEGSEQDEPRKEQDAG